MSVGVNCSKSPKIGIEDHREGTQSGHANHREQGSRCFASDSGSTALIAIAAEAPQMPTAPPVSKPKSRSQPSAHDQITPKSSVINTAAQTANTAGQPRAATSPTLNLSPSKATPNRRQGPDAHSSPRAKRSDSLEKWHDRPSNRPISIADAPYRWAMA